MRTIKIQLIGKSKAEVEAAINLLQAQVAPNPRITFDAPQPGHGNEYLAYGQIDLPKPPPKPPANGKQLTIYDIKPEFVTNSEEKDP